MAHYMVAEALHDLAQEGVTLAETHVPLSNGPAMQLFTKLGFEVAEHGTVYRAGLG